MPSHKNVCELIFRPSIFSFLFFALVQFHFIFGSHFCCCCCFVFALVFVFSVFAKIMYQPSSEMRAIYFQLENFQSIRWVLLKIITLTSVPSAYTNTIISTHTLTHACMHAAADKIQVRSTNCITKEWHWPWCFVCNSCISQCDIQTSNSMTIYTLSRINFPLGKMLLSTAS